MKKYYLSLMLVFAMMIGLLQSAVYADDESQASNAAAGFADMPANWSTTALQHAVANGLLKGSNGMIKPNDRLTRAELAAIVVRAFGADTMGDLKGYTDVDASAWYAEELAKAYRMGVISGSDGKMRPTEPITRQEVSAILARAVKLKPASTINTVFSDVGEISDWAKGDVYALVNAGYIHGADGKLNPTANMTRAEFAQLLDNMIKQYVSAPGTVSTVAQGNMMVNAPGVTLKQVSVSGDLIIGDGVGDGEVTLDDVSIAGRLVVRGGGANSIIIKGNSSVSNVIVARVSGVVSVKVQDNADVQVIYVDDGSDDVNVQGTVGSITVEAPDVTVTAKGATIKDVSVSGRNSIVLVDENSSVEQIVVRQEASNAKVEVAGTVKTITTAAKGSEITGAGKVEKVKVEASASDSKISTPKTEIEVGKGATGVTGAGGAGIEEGSNVVNNDAGTDLVRPSAPSGGSSGSATPPADTTPPVITLLGEASVEVKNGAVYTDAGVQITDNRDTGLVPTVTYTKDGAPVSSVDTTVAGTYVIHYNVSDAAGNDAVEVTREVIVLEVNMPVITNVHIESNHEGDSAIATIGDIITLMFTTDEPVEKLSNFKINSSNPDTFTNEGNVYTATHLVDAGDPVTGEPATFQINVKNDEGIYSLTIEATTDGSSVTIIEKQPIITNVSIASSNAVAGKAKRGDTITLTFTTNEPVEKLGNFKINSSNPDTFTNIGNVYTATHAVDEGDPVTGEPVTFQINVKNELGIYSQTIEATTDDSSVVIVDKQPIITNVSIASSNAVAGKAKRGDTITLTFTTDEPVEKLGNFKINSSNPDTFTNIGNVYTATHVVDEGDPVTGEAATFQINVKNELGIYSQTIEATTDDSSVVIVDKQPIISNVHIESNHVGDQTIATIGDIITLTFTADEPVTKLGNFKINSSNPDTFDLVDGVYIATHLVDAGDPVTGEAATFQINVKNELGIYSQTIEASTDSSSVTVVDKQPLISNVHIESNHVGDQTIATIGDIITLTFTADEPVTKLGNFKINSSNPDTFDLVDGVYTATHLVDAGDPVTGEAATFQINVKNDAGIYSLTVESTTDGSSVTIMQPATTTTLADVPDPSEVGESVMFTAAVAAVASGAGTPTGTVVFDFGDGSPTVPVVLVGGIATTTYAYTTTAGSPFAITVTYGGDANFTGSMGTGSHTVNAAATSIAVTDVPDPSEVGESVTLTATVAVAAPGAGTPTGTVVFDFGDGSPSGPVALVGGIATTTHAYMTTAGSPFTITVTYGGDANFMGSMGTETHTVNAAATTTTVTALPDPLEQGEAVTLTATVSAAAPGAGTPTGTVVFDLGGTTTAPIALVGGVATTTATPSSTGALTITATYSGDSNYTVSIGTDSIVVNEPAPTITSLSPGSGPTSGGNTVTITGTGFTGATSVTFGVFDAASFTVNSDTQITATAPAGVSGTVYFKVTTPAGSGDFADGYTYVEPPTITGMSPTQGSAAGGDSVTIEGSNLANATSVSFDGVDGTITANTSTSITVVTPAHTTGAVDVAVTTVGGSDTVAEGYTYAALPTIISVSPNSGLIDGGESITITGTGFVAPVSVTFNGSAATSVTVDSDTQITVIAPIGIMGTVDVVVTTPSGSATATGAYTYYIGP